MYVMKGVTMFINLPIFFMIEIGLGVLSFLGIIGVVIFYIIRNNRQPRLQVSATVVAKRTSNHTKATDRHYFATFQVESGDRIEFWIDSFQYSELIQDDCGILTFQGTRFLSFERDIYLSSVPKGLRILDVISWLPEEEASRRELEEVFMNYMEGQSEAKEYKVVFSMPDNVNDNVLDANFYLTEEGRKSAFILRQNQVVAVIGYK